MFVVGATEVLLELFYDVDVEGWVWFFAEGLEVGENAVLGARTECPFQQSLEAGQAMRVIG